MDNEINYQNNPLHSVGLKALLTELIDHYGFEILYAYLNINCFKTNPSIESSIKFLKKTEWAREKVESFYLYQFKSLPRASDEQFVLPPRERIIPDDQKPGEPAALSFEDAERLAEKREKKWAATGQGGGRGSNRNVRAPKQHQARDKGHDQSQGNESSDHARRAKEGKVDPWANARNRTRR